MPDRCELALQRALNIMHSVVPVMDSDSGLPTPRLTGAFPSFQNQTGQAVSLLCAPTILFNDTQTHANNNVNSKVKVLLEFYKFIIFYFACFISSFPVSP